MTNTNNTTSTTTASATTQTSSTAMFTMEPTDPLYLHPAESTHPVVVDTKLTGIENYLEWKRQMEIAICAKRKLGFLTGVVKRPTNDPLREAAWDTCNCLLITWIMHNVDQPIKRSVMCTRTAKEIWDYLQTQFSVSNGARKFRLNKELDDLSQGDKSICEYFTELRILWQNIEIMSDWPPVTQVTTEINAWLDAQIKEQNERKLFQFLNGLNPSYTTMRSHILMMNPLPTVEEAAAIFQQEEAQRRNYKSMSTEKMESDNLAFYAADQNAPVDASSCPVCKKKGHARDNCWRVVGYPVDHPVSIRFS
ncbi:uncharacterized protein LOC141644442 [Silene latifolia]|uniref:uncharacterized protein LOC141644442 n=1 Tax=Silene latifolia TaxID=37657 RepID=UPI003D77C3DE